MISFENDSTQNRNILSSDKSLRHCEYESKSNDQALAAFRRKPYENLATNDKVFHKVLYIESENAESKLVTDVYKKMALVEMVREHATDVIASRSINVKIYVEECHQGTGKKYVYGTLIVRG